LLISRLAREELFHPGGNCILVCLIDNQTSTASGDFSKRTVFAADARSAMPKTLENRKTEPLHEGRINGEQAFSIGLMKGAIVDMSKPANASPK
jgi:hypothetical protein